MVIVAIFMHVVRFLFPICMRFRVHVYYAANRRSDVKEGSSADVCGLCLILRIVQVNFDFLSLNYTLYDAS